MSLFLRILFGWLGLLGVASGAEGVVPPKLIDQPEWPFPLAAERAGLRSGEVQAVISLSDRGELLDFILLGASHPAFAAQLAQMLPEYRFAPARIRGEPMPVRMPVKFSFRQEGAMVSFTANEKLAAQFQEVSANGNYTWWLCLAAQLDRPLVVVNRVSPAYPDELRARGEAGEVTIDFYVDNEGRVRLPAAETNAHLSFAREAIRAVEQWRFEPPTSGGRPAIVHVVQAFRFPSPGPEDGKRAARM